METMAVTDLYQASYFLLSGCALTGIECGPAKGNNLACTLYFSGQNLEGLKENWFNRKAMANLWAFRFAYAQIHDSIREAKKNYTHSPDANERGDLL